MWDLLASATYFPKQVVESDTKSHDITLKVLPAPVFEGSEAYAVQQGAGMVVTKASEEEEKASVEFLKWFTRTENNIAFSVGSGYLPVTREANDRKKIKSCNTDISDSMEEILSVGVDTVNTSTMYTPKAFEGSNDARNILEHTMSDLATADRTVVEERIQNGEDLETAAADFLTEEYFKSWYQDTLSKLQAFER
ncbi:MAG: extracellular solute-binding protein [Blautia sp.]